MLRTPPGLPRPQAENHSSRENSILQLELILYEETSPQGLCYSFHVCHVHICYQPHDTTLCLALNRYMYFKDIKKKNMPYIYLQMYHFPWSILQLCSFTWIPAPQPKNWSIFPRAGLLTTKSWRFLLPENAFTSSPVLKNISIRKVILSWQLFFFSPCSKDVVPLPPGLYGFWWESSDIESVVLCLRCVLYLWPLSRFPFYLWFLAVWLRCAWMCFSVYFQFCLECMEFLEPKAICLSHKLESSSHYFFERFFCLTLSLQPSSCSEASSLPFLPATLAGKRQEGSFGGGSPASFSHQVLSGWWTDLRALGKTHPPPWVHWDDIFFVLKKKGVSDFSGEKGVNFSGDSRGVSLCSSWELGDWGTEHRAAGKCSR